MTETERKHRENLREIRRLQMRIAQGKGSTATRNALDRRLNRDRILLQRLAEQKEER